MQVSLSKQLLEWFNATIDEEENLRKDLNKRLKHIVKPCWELKFCPYGLLVEDFPVAELADDYYCFKNHSKFEAEAMCRQFGHLCPAYFVSEPFTETTEERKRSRSISRDTLIRVVRRDNNTCQICGKILLDKDIEIDHIIPYSRGGSSDESNLRVTCLECNRKKGKKW